MLRPLFLVLCFPIGLCNGVEKRYDRNKIIRVTAESPDEVEQLIDFKEHLESLQVDIWQSCSTHGGNLDFRLAPDMTYMLDGLDMKYQVLIPDVQRLIDDVSKSNKVKRQADQQSFDYGNYHSLEEIERWMNSVVLKYDNLVEIFPIAKSFEGRKLNGFKISVESWEDKPGIWLQAGLHAREWIAPATVIYMAYKFLEEYKRSPNVTEILEHFDIYVVPVINVDGYVHTWTSSERLWRKSRSEHPGYNCTGVDMNRNWDFHWCEIPGSSSKGCSTIFCGPSPFSEDEVRGVADYILKNTSNLVAFLDFHSYSQMWLSPWGYTKTPPADSKHKEEAMAVAVDAIRSLYGTKTTYGTASTLYYATGLCTDWAHGVANISYSVGVELRDNGTYGFLLPPDQILPTGRETFQGLLAYLKYIIETNGTLSPPTSIHSSSIVHGYTTTTQGYETHSGTCSLYGYSVCTFFQYRLLILLNLLCYIVTKKPK